MRSFPFLSQWWGSPSQTKMKMLMINTEFVLACIPTHKADEQDLHDCYLDSKGGLSTAESLFCHHLCELQVALLVTLPWWEEGGTYLQLLFLLSFFAVLTAIRYIWHLTQPMHYQVISLLKCVVIVSSVSQCNAHPEEKQLNVNGFALGISQPIGPN